MEMKDAQKILNECTLYEYTVTQLWFVYHISRQSSKNILNLQIEQYFPNNLYFKIKIFFTHICFYVHSFYNSIKTFRSMWKSTTKTGFPISAGTSTGQVKKQITCCFPIPTRNYTSMVHKYELSFCFLIWAGNL